VSLSLDRVGDVAVARNDLAGAQAAYAEGLGIARKLAALDASSARAQRDVMVSLAKLAAMKAQGVTWAMVVQQLELMQSLGMIAPRDSWMLAEARANMAKQQAGKL
jgi:hypothetical protein